MADARWREDFPVRWDEDHYMTRRELAKFLTLGSGLLAGANLLIAFVGLSGRAPEFPTRRVVAADDVAPGTSRLFSYPTDDDPCILVRDRSGHLSAYSQVCTHLSCAVVYQPDAGALGCPCHRGVFDAADGRPIAGPPTRRLPRIRLEQRGADIVATGVEV